MRMIITTSTLTEAQPFIDFFDLKPVQKRPFPIYEKPPFTLIVTGIGPLRASAALSHILTKKAEPVMNFGISAGKKVGKIYNIYKVIDAHSHKSYILKRSNIFENAVLKSYATPVSTKQNCLADMEGAALAGCVKLYGQDIEIVKLVSDAFTPDTVDMQNMAELIKKKIKPILDTIASKKGLQ